MYCLILSIVYIKSFLTISGLRKAACTAQWPWQQKMETLTVKSELRGAWPYMQGNYFKADKPFVYIIKENSTNAIMFMGKVGKPVYEEE